VDFLNPIKGGATITENYAVFGVMEYWNTGRPGFEKDNVYC